MDPVGCHSAYHLHVGRRALGAARAAMLPTTGGRTRSLAYPDYAYTWCGGAGSRAVTDSIAAKRRAFTLARAHAAPVVSTRRRAARQTRERRKKVARNYVASLPNQEGDRRPVTRLPTDDTRIVIEQQRERQDRFAREIPEAGRVARGTPGGGVLPFGTGCQPFTPELFPQFKSDLPTRYDGTTNPIDFVQLYTVGIQTAHGRADAMLNWFPMALKDSAR